MSDDSDTSVSSLSFCPFPCRCFWSDASCRILQFPVAHFPIFFRLASTASKQV